MKRFLIFSAVLGLLFASCSYVSDYDQTSCSIEVDKDFVSGMRAALLKNYDDKTQIRVNVECTGGYNTSQWRDATIGSLSNVVFTFDDVPYSKKFDIYVGVYYGSELIYEASQTGISITGTNPVLELSVVLKKLLNTQYVIYNKGVDDIQFYKADPIKTEVSGSEDFSSDSADFCFDSDGYVYYIKSKRETGADFPKPVICSDNPKIGSNGIDLSEAISVADSPNEIPYIFSIDRETKAFYIFPLASASEPKIYKFPKLVTNGDITEVVSFELNCSGVIPKKEFSKMVVNNGLMFVTAIRSEDNNPVVLKADVSSVQNNTAANAEVVANLASVVQMSNDCARISDMLYQDDAVYILGREVSEEIGLSKIESVNVSVSNYSRGVLVKYDVSSSYLKSLGFSKESKTNNEMDNYAMYAYQQSSYKQYFYDPSLTKPVFILGKIRGGSDSGNAFFLRDRYFPTVYTPSPLASSLSNSSFYGAEKFIAIKPKKLVIADDGFAFYTNSDGVMKYKNVNRVVTVDLEKFAITDSKNLALKLADEKSGLVTYGISTEANFREDMQFSSCVYYDSGSSTPGEESVTYNNTWYLGLPCEE